MYLKSVKIQYRHSLLYCTALCCTSKMCFLQIEGKNIHQQKDSLRFIVLVWHQAHNISKYACKYLLCVNCMPRIVVWEDKSCRGRGPMGASIPKVMMTCPPLFHFTHAQSPLKKEPGLPEDSVRWPERILWHS